MAKILFKGYVYGLRKVSLTKLFRYKVNLPLDIAKSKTDALLDGEIFTLKPKVLSRLKN